jgi:nucleotide-binding universal stress UspA family protein
VDHTKALVVVGVDGGPEGDAALRFALEEAERTGDSIEVITAWGPAPIPVAPYLPFGDLTTPDGLQRVARERQDAALARVLGDSPSVTVAARVQQGDAKVVLVEAARHARLLVVGSRPMGPVRAVLLGSVSRYCAHHSLCPVVVVPAAELAEVPARDRGVETGRPG